MALADPSAMDIRMLFSSAVNDIINNSLAKSLKLLVCPVKNLPVAVDTLPRFQGPGLPFAPGKLSDLLTGFPAVLF